jgi:asparagine synthase (glutamine-hydrolysing)
MCGIAGFAGPGNAEGARAILERMTGVLRHRGPADSGFHIDPAGVYLGHRRLSIVDVAGGRQPMSNEDGTVWIVYNGEIFNHAAVRPELERAGHRFRTRSDTETLLHAYEEYGPACLEKFRGMFAFAIWDAPRRTLFAARDRLGIKPFYYYWDGRLFAFASEIKALVEHPAISAAPEPEVLPEYLCFGFVSEERTMFRGIRQLMPGHHLALTLGEAGPALSGPTEYWDVPAPPSATGRGRPDEEYVAEVRRALEETVRLRLMSDVPLGAFLSGGLDSSAITSLVCRMAPAPVKTFSVGYPEARYSELGYARQVARALGAEHREVIVTRDAFFEALPRLIWHEDKPITWPSSVALYFVARLASGHVKVVLTGEGGDELFAGYERYRWTLWNLRAGRAYAALPAGLRRAVRRWIRTAPLLNASLRRKLGHTFLGREASIESLYLDNFLGAFGRDGQARLLEAESGSPYASYLTYWNRRADAPFLSRLLYADQKTYLVELLMKQDRMSMAASIESRVPLLDHQFLALAMSLPDRMKIRGADQKHVLKRAAADLLPRQIVYRTKMGFPTPLGSWFAQPASEPLWRGLLARDAFVAAYLNQNEIAALIERHRAGREDATDRLWRLVNLELWGGVFFGAGKRQVPPAAAS